MNRSCQLVVVQQSPSSNKKKNKQKKNNTFSRCVFVFEFCDSCTIYRRNSDTRAFNPISKDYNA